MPRAKTTPTTKAGGSDASSSPPTPGYDAAGHMDPKHRQRLLELSREGKRIDADAAFINAPRSQDDLAEGLAEAAVASMNSGEEQLAENLNAEVVEERGGPFVKTTAGIEFAEGTDESNIKGATREPFPTT
jgi:hypothetical protein